MLQNRGVLTLRRIGAADLSLVEAWLRDPEVARWYLAATSIENELDDLRQCIAGDQETEALISIIPCARAISS
jgi:hypothetical protein